jgi:hypothetical protein
MEMRLDCGAMDRKQKDPAMSASLWSAGRNAHVRIVAVALVAAIIVVVVGIYSRITTSGTAVATVKADRPVLRTGQPATYTDSAKSSIR